VIQQKSTHIIKIMAKTYSLSHLTLLDCSIAELAFIAARSGYNAISPRLHNMGVDGECLFPPLDKSMLAAARNAIAVTGMQVHDIELARITDDTPISAYEPAMEIGAELGARKMIASIWTSHTSSNRQVELFIELCQLAKQYNIDMALEYPTISSVSSLAQAREIVDQAQQDNAEILIDTMYIKLSHTRLDELEAIPHEQISFIQIADVQPSIPDTREGIIQLVRNGRLYPGEGSVDFTNIMSRLPPVDIAIELPNRARIRELGLEGHARKALQCTKQILTA
jgi:sugar phosphate isomerase/epimerase